VWIGWMYNKWMNGWMNKLRLHSAGSSGEWWRANYESPLTQQFWRNLSFYPIIRREALTKSQNIYRLPISVASQMGSLSAKISPRCSQQKKKKNLTTILKLILCKRVIRISECLNYLVVYYQPNTGVWRLNFSLSHQRISFVTTLI
jgi:hypothetical protein